MTVFILVTRYPLTMGPTNTALLHLKSENHHDKEGPCNEIVSGERRSELFAIGQNAFQEQSGPQPEQPAEVQHIQEILTAPRTTKVQQEYFIPYMDLSKRSDSVCPDNQCISPLHVARMKQLVDFFPDGVCIDYFIDIYKKILGNPPKLNGYSFPKDDDHKTSFHLPSVFWIPDNDAYHLPKRLLFPVKSSKKYSGSLQPLLQAYWNLLVKFMEGRSAIHLNDEFDFEDNDAYFHAKTGIWFSYKRWGLLSYVEFFELLLENFDRDSKLYTILFLPPEEPGCLRQRIFLVISGKDGEFARQFEQNEIEKFPGIKKVTKQEPQCLQLIKQRTIWLVEEMSFPTVDKIRMEPYESRVFDVVAAGNIQDFYLFNVLLVEDIPKRDRLLKTIHNLVCEISNPTAPDSIVEKCVVIFLNTKRVWRRGVILDHNKTNNTVKVLDIDTGETKAQIPLDWLRNITSTLFHLPVLAVPVRFCVHHRLQNYFIGNTEGNRVLGKYLHMMLIEANKGLRLRFFRWDSGYTHYIPGVWVVKGFLIDIIQNMTIFPRVSISDYLLEKFKNRKQDELVPEWPEELDEDADFGTLVMRERHSDITYLLNYFSGVGADHLRDFSWNKNSPKVPRELEVDKDRKEEPVATIFQDEEFGGCRIPLKFCTKRGGLRGLFKTNVVLESIREKQQQREKINKYNLRRSGEKPISIGKVVENPILLTIKHNNLETVHRKIIIDHSKLLPNDKYMLENIKLKRLIRIPVTVITDNSDIE